jgi:phage terminase large subunit-like protein
MEPWKEELESILKLVPGYNPWDQAAGVGAWLDHEAAIRAINFFAEHLKHVEGDAAGEPFILLPWQAAIVGNLFGWKRKDEKGRIVRRYRKAWIRVPRGNGKTPLAAGIVILTFFEDKDPGAQDYLAAGQASQAGYLFRNARGMINQDDYLKSQVTIYAGDQHRCIVKNDDPLSFCKVIPADAAAQHGGIPSVIVLDEVHVQENRDLVDVFETGLSKKTRAQPLFVMITTSDYERESICNEMDDHAIRVRDNGGDPAKPGYDPTFLPVIYGADKDDDWKIEATWRKANPNLGVSVSLESLADACRKAQENPAFENTFRRLHLNQRTKQEFRLISVEAWDACVCPDHISLADLEGRDCYGGLDLASTDDLASFTLEFPLEDEWMALLSFSWCPQERIGRRARQKYPYDVWANSGYEREGLPNFLTGTDGDWIDYRRIRADVVKLSKRFHIKEIGYDPHGAAQLMQDFRDSDGLEIFPVTQSFRNLAGPTKQLVRRVKMRKYVHFGNPLLRWSISNAAAHFDGQLPKNAKIEECLDKIPVMFSKRKSADKIDPLAALVLAEARMGEHPQEDGRSVYESRGFISIG